MWRLGGDLRISQNSAQVSTKSPPKSLHISSADQALFCLILRSPHKSPRKDLIGACGGGPELGDEASLVLPSRRHIWGENCFCTVAEVGLPKRYNRA
jgi:hypothetical protein